MTWSKTLLITSIAGLTFFPWPSLLDPAAAATAPSPKVWKNSPICRDDYFPLAVWLQDPINAAKYQQIGINLFVGLWQGPTQEQLDVLKRSGMSVICEQNNVALQNLDNKAIIGCAPMLGLAAASSRSCTGRKMSGTTTRSTITQRPTVQRMIDLSRMGRLYRFRPGTCGIALAA
jgi:hypothetical protein